MKSLIRTFAAAIAVLLAAGCTGMIPMYNIDGRSIDGDPTQEEVTKAIKIGAATAGWRTEVVDPGHILATYNIRAHTVIVDIRYTTESYSILYTSSLHMKIHCTQEDYDNHRAVQVTPDDDCPKGIPPAYIHGNYRDWIDGLDRGIAAALSVV